MLLRTLQLNLDFRAKFWLCAAEVFYFRVSLGSCFQLQQIRRPQTRATLRG